GAGIEPTMTGVDDDDRPAAAGGGGRRRTLELTGAQRRKPAARCCSAGSAAVAAQLDNELRPAIPFDPGLVHVHRAICVDDDPRLFGPEQPEPESFDQPLAALTGGRVDAELDLGEIHDDPVRVGDER